MRHWYNETAAMTAIPEETADHLAGMERGLSEMLRVPLQAPLSAAYDSEFLLRFRTEKDVRRWARFILDRLPEWMEEMTAQWRSCRETTSRDMTPHQRFLDAIQADPDTDAPRLAYADWLAERGDAWSEVIRIQCRYPDGYMPWETAERLNELLHEHQHRYDRGADDLSVYVQFRRGMVEEVYCSAEAFLKAATGILERFPLVNVLSLYNIRRHGIRLANQPELSAMRSLKMAHLADDDWQSIVQSPYLGRVERLRVAFPRPIDLSWLLDMSLARQLHVLDLTGSQLDANGLAAFGQTDAGSGLETLVLSDTRMDDEMARSLSKVATFRDLKRLSVADNPDLGIEGIVSLLEAEFAPRLEVLAVGCGWFDDYLVRDLAESQLSSTVRLSMGRGFAGLDKEEFTKRFPNCSFGDNRIARHL
jgi:uncharacterized protein (TIGR02996 family)